MKIKHYQKVSESIKEAITRITPREAVKAVELYRNQKVKRFWGLKEKTKPNFMLVVNKKWAK